MERVRNSGNAITIHIFATSSLPMGRDSNPHEKPIFHPGDALRDRSCCESW
jgi:hypothetical protein